MVFLHALHDGPEEFTEGKKLRSFAENLEGVFPTELPERLADRKFVFSLVRDRSIDTPTVCAAILAWGGMRKSNSISLYKSSEWLVVAEKIRLGLVTRENAYRLFLELRKQGLLKGMGPAYFTKLIYFLMPRGAQRHPVGFIMDQWAGCAINLLSGSQIALMNYTKSWVSTPVGLEQRSAYIVSDENTPENYELFCEKIDTLADGTGLTVDQIDTYLFSVGGREPGVWRKYVIENRI